MSNEGIPWVRCGQLVAEELRAAVDSCGERLSSPSPRDQRRGTEELHRLITLAWSLETRLARDAADAVCDGIRENSGLEALLRLCCAKTKGPRPPGGQLEVEGDDCLWLSALKALEQIMMEANRAYISQHALFGALVGVASKQDSGSVEVVRCGTGVLENLFKVSEQVCGELVRSGGLQGVISACRCTDPLTLLHCAAALANCAMYGGPAGQAAMMEHKADHWLFPLALHDSAVVRYYAFLAISFLAANKALEEYVARSGTLELVLPFLLTQNPEEFAAANPTHVHGRAAEWLSRLLPLLECGNEEACSLAAFYFAMEAGVKKRQQRLKVFEEIGAVDPLRKAAREGTYITSSFSCQALRLSCQLLPGYCFWNVLQWDSAQVEQWVCDIGLTELAKRFSDSRVCGSMLVDTAMEDLLGEGGVGMHDRLMAKWFLKQVRALRLKADPTCGSPRSMRQWLRGIGRELCVYTVDFERRGVGPHLLPHLPPEVLAEVGVASALDRLRIGMEVQSHTREGGGGAVAKDSPDTGSFFSPALRKKYDVFISYRRATGSQLASLLKVHLQLRGLSVFLDVTQLGAGNFNRAILTTIGNSLNMVMVLSQGALDRCLGDVCMQDWVHRELRCALDSSVHVVPVMDNFTWPEAEQLPPGIQPLCRMNGVSWNHEYQEACINKLISFLKLPVNARKRTQSKVERF